MNLLDRAIESVAPTWALRRAHARARLELARATVRRYEGADRGRRTSGWITPDSSPATATRGSLEILRARCRDLRRNNPWARSAVEALVSDIAGDGIRVKWDGESEALVARVKQRWADWTETPACDANGRSTFAAMQATLCRSMVEGGQALVRRRWRQASDRLPVPLQLQPLEADFIDTWRDELQDKNGNRTVQGKAYDAVGRLTGYWLFRTHPGDLVFGSRADAVFVPASEVLDLYVEERVGQVRGIPWGAPVVLRLHDLDAYEDNEALRLVIATSFAGFVHDLSPDASFVDGVSAMGAGAQKNDKDQAIDHLEAGTVEHLPPGKTITFPNVPTNEGFEAFTSLSLRAVARGFGTTYESMTGDYSGFTFSSARMAHLAAHRNYTRVRRHVIVPHLCEPAARWFLDALQVAGELSDKDRASLTRTWIPPRREVIDPRTETEAMVAQVRAGFYSLTDVVEGLGQDAEATLQQLAADLELARKLDLKLSTDGENDDPGEVQSVNASNGSDRVLEDDRGLQARNGHPAGVA